MYSRIYGKWRIKTRYKIFYNITSLGVNEIKDFCRAIRDEWGIENNLHWHLDVTFKEDNNRMMIKNAQANLNILKLNQQLNQVQEHL